MPVQNVCCPHRPRGHGTPPRTSLTPTTSTPPPAGVTYPTSSATDLGGPRRSLVRTFARKVDADHFLIEIEANKQRGSFVDPRRASPTVGDLADEWLAAQADLSPTTRNR
jgi:hypothetical protein